MKSRRRTLILFGLLFVLLVCSLALNLTLYRQSERYYAELNRLRLDPLEQRYFEAAEAPQSGLPAVVFYGDSRAAEWPYPGLAEFEFSNRGIPAQTTIQVLKRFDSDVRPLKPAVVVIQVGINDLKTIPLFPEDRGTIVSDCGENIRGLVTKATDEGADVILTTIFPVGDVPLERRMLWSDDVEIAIGEVNDFIRSLEERVTILDAYMLLADDSGRIKSEYGRDFLHLSPAGYEQLNRVLVPILEGLKYSRSSPAASLASSPLPRSPSTRCTPR